MRAALPTPEQQTLREGADPIGGTPRQFVQFVQFVQEQYGKWRAVARESGATAQ